MNSTTVFVIAFAIGIVAGLRSMTAPAVVSWGAKLKWLHLESTHFSFLGSPVAVVILTLAAIVEIVVDKLPKTPSRTAPPGLITRFVTGWLSGAAVCTAANQSWLLGGLLGGVGGIAGAFTGYEARTRLVKALGLPDYVVAVFEDAVAIGLGLFLVS